MHVPLTATLRRDIGLGARIGRCRSGDGDPRVPLLPERDLALQANRTRVGADELDGLHRRKTGALLTASLLVGALAAGASDQEIEGLERYGRAIGLAFQIADDVLDATASAETLGKNPTDAELDKSTYVSLYGIDEARSRAMAQVDDALGALTDAGIESPALDALARYVVERGK